MFVHLYGFQCQPLCVHLNLSLPVSASEAMNVLQAAHDVKREPWYDQKGKQEIKPMQTLLAQQTVDGVTPCGDFRLCGIG